MLSKMIACGELAFFYSGVLAWNDAQKEGGHVKATLRSILHSSGIPKEHIEVSVKMLYPLIAPITTSF